MLYRMTLSPLCSWEALLHNIQCIDILCVIQYTSLPMDPQILRYQRRSLVLTIMFLYLTLCGLSAIFFPQLWLLAAGIEAPNSDIALAVAGAMMCGLAMLSYQASRDPLYMPAAVSSLITAHGCDAAVVAYFTFLRVLPLSNASVFLLIDVGWIYALLRLRK